MEKTLLGGKNSITKSFKQLKLLTREGWGGLPSSVFELIVCKKFAGQRRKFPCGCSISEMKNAALEVHS